MFRDARAARTRRCAEATPPGPRRSGTSLPEDGLGAKQPGHDALVHLGPPLLVPLRVEEPDGASQASAGGASPSGPVKVITG